LYIWKEHKKVITWEKSQSSSSFLGQDTTAQTWWIKLFSRGPFFAH